MTDIIPIHGGRVPHTPAAEVVAELERLLAEAKAGKLIGFAYATVSEDGTQATGWRGEAGTRHSLGTAVMMLNHRYATSLLHPEEED